MFRNPFSFNGRIRRLEYALTIVIWAILVNLMNNPGAEPRGI